MVPGRSCSGQPPPPHRDRPPVRLGRSRRRRDRNSDGRWRPKGCGCRDDDVTRDALRAAVGERGVAGRRRTPPRGNPASRIARMQAAAMRRAAGRSGRGRRRRALLGRFGNAAQEGLRVGVADRVGEVAGSRPACTPLVPKARCGPGEAGGVVCSSDVGESGMEKVDKVARSACRSRGSLRRERRKSIRQPRLYLGRAGDPGVGISDFRPSLHKKAAEPGAPLPLSAAQDADDPEHPVQPDLRPSAPPAPVPRGGRRWRAASREGRRAEDPSTPRRPIDQHVPRRLSSMRHAANLAPRS